MTTTRAQRMHGFTLIELLVVVAIIALLIGILLPTLSGARESARTVACKSHLRQLAIASLTHAADHKGEYCTGAWDARDTSSWGPLESKGWIADFVNGEYALPGRSLCPSCPAQTTQTWSSKVLDDADAWRTYTTKEVDDMVSAGFNTNYCQSWFMAHTQMKQVIGVPSETKNRNFTKGPLRDAWMTEASASLVPLFGDGTAKTLTESDWALIKGEMIPGAKALSDGPLAAFKLGAGAGAYQGRQDYDDFGPAHSKGRMRFGEYGHDRTIGNIAFADGHVDSFRDTNNDGGFGAEGSQIINGWRTHIYHELEGKIFGGTINGGGPGW